MFAADALARSVALVALDGEGELLAGAVAVEVPHPIDRVPEGLLHTFCLRADGRGDAAGGDLLARVTEEATARGWRFLRSLAPFEEAAAAVAAGFEVAAVEVHRDLRGPAGERPRPDLAVAPAAGEDRDFVVRLVAGAVARGLHPAERALVDGACVERRAAELVDRVLAGPSVVLVARDGDRRVGHALCEVGALDEVTGAREPVLHDACAEDGEEGRGVSATLTVAVEDALRVAGEEVVAGVVAPAGDGDLRALLASVRGGGWRPGRARLLRPLER